MSPAVPPVVNDIDPSGRRDKQAQSEFAHHN
jgi:hypothetical protein